MLKYRRGFSVTDGDASWFNNPQYHLSVDEPTECFVSLMQGDVKLEAVGSENAQLKRNKKALAQVAALLAAYSYILLPTCVRHDVFLLPFPGGRQRRACRCIAEGTERRETKEDGPSTSRAHRWRTQVDV